ncbi:MAG: ABC transporter substrate-binding protein [Clostridia bacterium]|nr:ABC transporter substrate-binding protein [Clostridia bacterium]
MKKTIGILTLALALCLCLGLAQADGVTVTDMMGREITLSEPATRIVALTASDCEILCALGCGDALVGRGEYCDYPESVLAVPSVQSGYETNLEQIVALQPQVVLMSTMAQSAEQVDQLTQAGIAVVVSDAKDIEGVYTSIRLIGALMGKDTEAEALVSLMQDVFAQIGEQSEDTGKTVYFEVSPLQWGLWTAGRGTFMDELAAMCGLTNIFADVEGWAEISEEQVLARNPDFIVTITMYYGEGPTPVEEILSRPGWDTVTAVRNGAILNADSNEISRPGPRLMDAATTLLHFVQEHEAAEIPAA